MKSIHTESYENLGKNMSEEDIKVFLGKVDHRLLLDELNNRLNRSVERDSALGELVAKYER